MIKNILDLFAPNYCIKCNKIGARLCNKCKKYIIYDAKINRPLIKPEILNKPYISNFYVFDWREGILKNLIDEYKFNQNIEIANHLLDFVLEILPNEEYIVIPLPTSNKHKKERNLAHIEYLCKKLCSKRKLDYMDILKRKSNEAQLGKSRKDRLESAKNNYYVDRKISSQRKYLLIDDIFTTGASVRYACDALHKAGAKDIDILVLARQKDF